VPRRERNSKQLFEVISPGGLAIEFLQEMNLRASYSSATRDDPETGDVQRKFLSEQKRVDVLETFTVAPRYVLFNYTAFWRGKTRLAKVQPLGSAIRSIRESMQQPLAIVVKVTLI
jgi:hypothetical protein